MLEYLKNLWTVLRAVRFIPGQGLGIFANINYVLHTCVEPERVKSNIRRNVSRGWPELAPVKPSDMTIVFVCGAPSVEDYIEEIRERAKDPKVAIFTSNFTHNWLLKNGIVPWGMFIIDPDDGMEHILATPHPEVMYFCASQCAPYALDRLEDFPKMLCHLGGEVSDDVYEELELENPIFLHGGSTAPLRAMSLAWVLGCRRIEYYGLDSCYPDDGRHYVYDHVFETHDFARPQPSYLQTEDGREFHTCAQMAAQAAQFQGVLDQFGGELEAIVHGDGLIAHLLKESENEGT